MRILGGVRKILENFGGVRKIFEKFGGVRNFSENFGGVRKTFENFGGVRKIFRYASYTFFSLISIRVLVSYFKIFLNHGE